MKTLAAVVILIVIGFFGQTFWLTALNLAGLPGALIGGSFRRDAGWPRAFLGIILAILGQSYVYLAFVALVVVGTNYYIHREALSPIFVWPASFFACIFPIYCCAAAANAEYSEGSGSGVQTNAVLFGQLVAVIGFFVFVFSPNMIAMGWPWISWLVVSATHG
jgi:hypothetical protein